MSYVNPNEVESVQIVGVSVANFMRIKLAAVALEPGGGVIAIQGRNAQGKTSFTAAMQSALAGAKATPDNAIRDGADRAEVVVTLSDGRDVTLIVNMTITAHGGRQVTIRTADGTVQPKPQELLDALLSKFCFDPFEFADLPDTKRCDRLMGGVDLGFEPVWWQAEYDRIFAARRDANRDAGQLESAFNEATLKLTGTSDPAEQAAAFAELNELPEQETDLAELSRQQQAALAEHRKHDALVQESQQAFTNAQALKDRSDALLAEIQRLQGELDTCQQQRVDAVVTAGDLQSKVTASADNLPSLDEIGQRISGVDELNRKIRAVNEYRALHARSLAANSAALALDVELNGHRELKRQALESATLPVDGLRFELINAGESNEKLRLLFNGHPFDNASSAEKLDASIDIAMALSGKSRDMFVRQGNLHDPERLELLKQRAAQRGTRIWLEQASDGSGASERNVIVIEDGEIVEQAQGVAV